MTTAATTSAASTTANPLSLPRREFCCIPFGGVGDGLVVGADGEAATVSGELIPPDSIGDFASECPHVSQNAEPGIPSVPHLLQNLYPSVPPPALVIGSPLALTSPWSDCAVHLQRRSTKVCNRLGQEVRYEIFRRRLRNQIGPDRIDDDSSRALHDNARGHAVCGI